MSALRFCLLMPILMAPLPLGADLVGQQVAQPAVQDGQDLRVRSVRFWRPNSRATLLEAFVGQMVFGDTTPGPPATPRIQLVVIDAMGQEIHRSSWMDTISAGVRTMAAAQGQVEVTEHLRVALLPGSYDFHVIVAERGREDSISTRIDAFDDAPLVSDVLISSAIRLLDEGEAAAAAEVVKGDYAIQGGSRVVLVPTQAELWYYVEMYAPQAADPVAMELALRVEPRAGDGPSVDLSRSMLLESPGAVDAARLDLTGMPPGDYRFMVTATAGDRSERRVAEFSIGAFGTGPQIANTRATGGVLTEPQLHDRYFSPEAMDSGTVAMLVQALTVAPPGPSVELDVRSLDLQSQRRYLARYFGRLGDPATATSRHELIDEYVERVRVVEREYGERDIGRPGIGTDRGRIYLRYGPPDDRLLLPMTQNRAVEAWRYSRNRNLKFVFLDETGFQHYNLIYAEDPNEQTLPDWERRVGSRDVIARILSF